MNKHYFDVENYFNDKAHAYDDVDSQLYWVFSDEFFKRVLEAELPKLIQGDSIRLLDAGAGTGRWTKFIFELFGKHYDISGDLVDISPKMLEVAAEKIQRLGLNEKFKVDIGNIEKMEKIKDNYYNLSISFYNVISFVERPLAALTEIRKKLEDGGAHISIVANKYHSYYFSVLVNRPQTLDLISGESKIKFNDLMPAIHCFTPEEIKKLYLEAGFSKVEVLGGPNFIYPGMEETFVHGQTESIQNKLEDKDFFRKLLDIELGNYKNGDIVGRANALMVIARK